MGIVQSVMSSRVRRIGLEVGFWLRLKCELARDSLWVRWGMVLRLEVDEQNAGVSKEQQE